jgi:hypothetical protein
MLEDFGEQGTSKKTILIEQQTLFGNPLAPAPSFLAFRFTLPTSFSDGDDQFVSSISQSLLLCEIIEMDAETAVTAKL